jgi:dihydropyrimidinase
LTRQFEGVSTYFVHVSTREGIEAVSQIKCESDHVFAETTSPYLLFSIEGARGNLPKWLPPLRNKESQEALWEKLGRGKIDALGTDSVPMSQEIKGLGKTIWEAMPNAPTVEHHLPGLLTEGFANRKIPMATLADPMTRRPAEIFGIFPRKGSLIPGSDADLVVVDMDRWQKVSRDQIKSASPFSLFEGRLLTGWPAIVIKGGRVVVKDGKWVADPPPCQVLNEPKR